MEENLLLEDSEKDLVRTWKSNGTVLELESILGMLSHLCCITPPSVSCLLFEATNRRTGVKENHERERREVLGSKDLK